MPPHMCLACHWDVPTGWSHGSTDGSIFKYLWNYESSRALLLLGVMLRPKSILKHQLIFEQCNVG